MFNNVAIDVFLGLTFVFLLYSLLATILQEAIAGLLNLRAAVLVKAVRVMLNDRQRLDVKTSNPVISVLIRAAVSLKNQWKFITCNLPSNSLAKAFYKHPSIKYLSASSIRSKPSYIHPENFSSTIVKILRGRYYDGSIPEIVAIYQKLHLTPENQLPIVTVGAVDTVLAQIKPETLDQFRQLYVDANQDIDKFKKLLENWYNDTMDRANGWYTRLAKRILFVMGFCIALAGNVDTIKIYHILATNQTAREQMVQLAVQSQSKYDTLPQVKKTYELDKAKFDSAAYAMVEQDVKQANSILGIGWVSDKEKQDYKKLLTARNNIAIQFNNIKAKDPTSPQLDLLRSQLRAADIERLKKKEQIDFRSYNNTSFLGWIITAFAITLGAPFWFDLLNRFISLRSSGKRPDSNTDAGNTNTNNSAAVQPAGVSVRSNTTAEEAVG
ncbi:hypothetical protein FC093_08735 [Ilyomonas limi]|uniref:Uncharacterized protein n=1 Tax=Ilyomonas limi TaxID=2575867 RepID=A0A4U3L3D2_9BACT|nr:hypothetical protein [Ilyomonas limi]TKK69392.1 hypothetical protein FC093_08735 [Ilyomonas limi]